MKPKQQTKKQMGRPAKVTLAKVEEIGKLMAIGVPEDYACALHGINPATFGPAVSRNPRYKAAMMLHHAQFMAESLAIIKKGGEVITVTSTDDEGKETSQEKVLPWSGRAWILERRYKPHFNRTDVVKDRDDAPGERGGFTAEQLLDMERITKALVLGAAHGE
jgi:hypothetical protein